MRTFNPEAKRSASEATLDDYSIAHKILVRLLNFICLDQKKTYPDCCRDAVFNLPFRQSLFSEIDDLFNRLKSKMRLYQGRDFRILDERKSQPVVHRRTLTKS